MRKLHLFEKRILALALSVSMVFASTDTYMVLAAETENLEAVSENAAQIDEAETASADSAKDPDTTGDLDEAGENDSLNSSGEAEETDSSNGSDEAGETDSSNDSDSVVDENETGERIDEAESVENETEDNAADETTEDDSEMSAVASGDISGGTTGGITWAVSENGLLIITGSGDYNTSNPPWCDSAVRDSIKSAVVKIENIKSVENMFMLCRNLTSVDLSGLDTSKLTSMNGMFSICSSLESVDLSGLDTSKVTDMGRMFYSCERLISVDLSGLDTSKVTDMSSMFDGCSSLVSVDLSGLDTSNVAKMGYMFRGCSSLTSVDLSVIDTGNVTTMTSMFSGCSKLESVNLSGLDISDLKIMTYMFEKCSSLKSVDLSGFASVNLSGLDTSNVTSMEGIFSGCSSLTSVDLSGLDTSNVTNMQYMFEGCSSLSSLDLSVIDAGNLMGTSYMFQNCSNLSSLDLSGLDTSKVTRMIRMFDGCSSLASLDLSALDTSNVTNMMEMFKDCSSLASVDLGGFDMGNVTTSTSTIFYGCSSLSYIYTPINCKKSVDLPVNNVAGKWYRDDGTICTTLPTDLSYSINLYKNGYPGDGKTNTKQVVHISGITIEDKVYDGMPNVYGGTAVVMADSSGNKTIDGITLSCVYTGTLIDGTPYMNISEAPTQAGKYTLLFSISDYNYKGEAKYKFSIKQKELTITAPSFSIDKGEQLPELSGLGCKVEGLIEPDKLTTAPLLKYSAEGISTAESGCYDIIPYGADAGNNYIITYVNGTLEIEEPGANIVDRGEINGITWTINKSGRLTITGTGDYVGENGYTPPWCSNKEVRDMITSAVVNVSGITDTRSMFNGCNNLTRVDLSGLDTSNVTNMMNMFNGCSSLVSVNLSGLNTSNVKNMSDMFYGCSSLTSVDLSVLDTSNVAYMEEMFSRCSSLVSVDLSGLDTSSVMSMSMLFNNCSSLVSVDLSGLDTSNVTSMMMLFSYCSSLVNVDLSGLDTSNVMDMGYVFYHCDNLTSVDLSGLDTSKVTNMSSMFESCSSLVSVDLSSLDISNVTDMGSMFSRCSSLVSVDLSGLNTSNVAYISYMSNMFNGCNSLTNVDLSGLDMSNVRYMNEEDMFDGCISLSYIRTPINCTKWVKLPISDRTDKWYQDTNMTHTSYLPMDLDYSIGLYKNGYPGDGKTKQFVYISGISIESKVYDGTPNTYDGTVVVTDSTGNPIDDSITPDYYYTGTLIDGTAYGKTPEAPTQAGKYTLSFVIPENNDYRGEKVYSFSIKQKKLTITAPSFSIKTGNALPELYPNECTIDGLIEGEELKKEPTLKYSAEDISTAEPGSYDIIPYGADAGDNYSIIYVNGKLTIEKEKQVVFISGITIENKVYDGEPILTGTAIVLDSEENILSDVATSFSYTGILADGSTYTEFDNAPSQAGSYTLLVEVTESDTYTGQSSYEFTIEQKELTITAPSFSIKTGNALPELSPNECTVDGLIENEGLIEEPTLKYSAEDISTAEPGSYDIIPYGADAGDNYSITYVNGKLTIEKEKQVVSISGITIENKVYDGEPILTGTAIVLDSEGNILSDVATSFSYTGILADGSPYTEFDNAPSQAGSYTLLVEVTESNTYTGQSSYEFTIEQKELTITAPSFTIKTGDELPALSGSDCKVNGLIGTDNLLTEPSLKYSTEVISTAEAGSYDIIPYGADAGNNYSITYIYGTLTVGDSGDNTGKDILIIGLKESYEYTGAKIIPAFDIVDYGVLPEKYLAPGVDYTVKYKNNKNVTKDAKAEVIITGKGNYSGKNIKSGEFSIVEPTVPDGVELEDLKGAKITMIETGMMYDSNAKHPKFTLRLKGGSPVEYTYDDGQYKSADGNYVPAKVALSNNVNKGTATLLLTGKDGSNGKPTTVKKTFKITAVDLAANAGDVTVVVNDGQPAEYAVKGAKPDVAVTYNGTPLKEGKDYTVKYSSNKKAGVSGKVVITGKGNYAKKYTGLGTSFDITHLDMSTIKSGVSAVTAYKGVKVSKIKATVVDAYGNALKPSQYTLRVYRTMDAAEACDAKDIIDDEKIYVEAEAKDIKNLYNKTIRTEFSVGTNIASAKVEGKQVKTITKLYTGESVKLEENDLKVTIRGVSDELKWGDDFEIVEETYSNNINKGNATVIIRGKGKYSGTKTIKFKISPKSMENNIKVDTVNNISNLIKRFVNVLSY